MNEKGTKELYVVKDHTTCQSYIINYVEPDENHEGGFYIQPGTVLLFKTINKKHSQVIYKATMDFINEIYSKKTRKNTANQALDAVDMSNIDRYVNEQMKILTETDRMIADHRLQFLRSAFKNNDDITHVMRYTFDNEEAEDIEIAEVLFPNNFDNVDIYEAAVELSEIGELTSKYTFEQLYRCTIKEKKLLEIIDKVYNFVHMYGLLGILTRLLTISPSIYLTNVDIESANVETFVIEAAKYIDPNHSTNTYVYKYGMMKMSDYLRLFFPNKPQMLKHYAEYALMDSRFWSTYSEPLNLFLLAARAFYEECKNTKNAEPKSMPSMNFNNMNIQFEHDNNTGINVFRMEFNSLYDAIRYSVAYNALRETKKVLICKNCHKLFLKGDNRERDYCNPATCGSRHRKNKSINKKRQAAEDKAVQ